MNWISKKYQQLRHILDDKEELNPIPLGKFSESPKTDFQLAAREASMISYQEKKWPDYAIQTLDYIFGQGQKNGYYQKEQDSDNYSIGGFHGSIFFEGEITQQYIHIESHILRTQHFKPSMLRLLLESSITFDFIKYGIDENSDIVAIIHLEQKEAGPRVIYSALKELCLNANIYDSLISSEYEDVHWLHQDHVLCNPQKILNLKYEKYSQELVEMKDFIKMTTQKNHKDLLKISYHLLGYIYKTDYLLSPGNYLYGYFIDQIEKYWNYIAQQNSDFGMATSMLKDTVEKIPEMSLKQFEQEAVRMPFLFSHRNPFDPIAIRQTFKSNLANLKIFIDENDFISLYWCIQVMIGGLPFHYDIDENWQEWLNALYACTDSLYMNELGYMPDFLAENSSKPDLEIIRSWLNAAIEKSQETEAPLPSLPEKLDMQDPLRFVADVLMVFNN